jgi:hypothetical protein
VLKRVFANLVTLPNGIFLVALQVMSTLGFEIGPWPKPKG